MSSENKIARLAGLLSVVLLVVGTFAQIVQTELIVPGDSTATVENIVGALSLFRIGVVSILVMYSLYALYPLLLYKIYEQTDKNYAVLMLVFGLIGIPIAMLNEANHFTILRLLDGTNRTFTNLLSTEQVHAQVMLRVESYTYGALIASFFWGIWLLPLGLLAFKSRFVPKTLGILLIIGCFGYVIRFFLSTLFQSYSSTFSPILAATHLGEVIHGLWLLIVGVNWSRKG